MKREETLTFKNLESAFAGESMAHIKYLYFAKICRAQGDIETAEAFEETASQEILHAFGHAELLFANDHLNSAKCLELAIAGETYEYTEMYPTFKKQAEEEGASAAIKEIDDQIAESKEHAGNFQAVLEKAKKRFTALAKVEEKHANNYKKSLEKVSKGVTV